MQNNFKKEFNQTNDHSFEVPKIGALKLESAADVEAEMKRIYLDPKLRPWERTEAIKALEILHRTILKNEESRKMLEHKLPVEKIKVEIIDVGVADSQRVENIEKELMNSLGIQEKNKS